MTWLTPTDWAATSHTEVEPDAGQLTAIKQKIKDFVAARSDRMTYDELRRKLKNLAIQGQIPNINKHKMTQILDAVESEYRAVDTPKEMES